MVTDLKMDSCAFHSLHISPITAGFPLRTILRAELRNTYKPPVKPAQPMHLIHVIAGTQGEQCFFLVSVFLLILNGSNPLIQVAIAHKMFLPFADDSFQRSADQFFFQQEPGQKRNVLLAGLLLEAQYWRWRSPPDSFPF